MLQAHLCYLFLIAWSPEGMRDTHTPVLSDQDHGDFRDIVAA